MASIFVGNLSYQATDADLREAFLPFGAVTDARVASSRETGRSCGFGFVEMPDPTEAQKAISGVNRQIVSGRSVRVTAARPIEDGPRL
jgi:RNA recognition motif-containing protein